MILRGKLYSESPIYRGNARKTLFTRDGDGAQRLVSLAGEIAGTAEALMDAFSGKSRNGKNIGLLEQMWLRLYGSPMPDGLVTEVTCRLQEKSYPRDRIFDVRMGIKLDEDRWAAESNANYKMETLYRNSVFDFTMNVNEALLKREENMARLYCVLDELKEGRFWFGAGKSKGLGRCRLEMDLPFQAPQTLPKVSPKANQLTVHLSFDTTNPVLVGWHWGKVTPEMPTFAAIEGRQLIEAIQGIPEAIRKRLEMTIGGPIISPEDWKKKLTDFLPRIIAIWLMDRASKEEETWFFPSDAVSALSKGKHALAPKLMDKIVPLTDKPFPTREDAESALNEALGKKANMGKRVLDALKHERKAGKKFDRESWHQVASAMGMPETLAPRLADKIHDEAALVKLLSEECSKVLPRFYQQIDWRIRLVQSDTWVDEEVASRQEHLRIKIMLRDGKIEEWQWLNPDWFPEGVRPSTWREFIDAHRRVQYRHMLNPKNLKKSITNDENLIAFLKSYRDRTRQELAQPENTDFRAGGIGNREISRKYGKPYDTVFMRMLSWSPSKQEGSWEVYIPGATVKGAFRKRASQILKTLWGESNKTRDVLDRLFGIQGQRGLIFFSDAYLADPKVSAQAWCSMDGVRMDPATGRPIEEAKADYLFACGENLVFELRMDAQGIDPRDMEAFFVFLCLLSDFQQGDVPLGGEKTCGFGWVQAGITKLKWMTTAAEGSDEIGTKLFGARPLGREGIWRVLNLEGKEAASALKPGNISSAVEKKATSLPPRAKQGFVSHRAFGGYCGVLSVKGEVLTPVSVKESGEPSFVHTPEDMSQGMINGWDFYSMTPPEAAMRASDRVYALPSKSIKGMMRHIYTIASDSRNASPDLGRLNPADSLFGWVGTGPNQALMGRVSFSFAPFDAPKLGWFKVPYPYGNWYFTSKGWEHIPDRKAQPLAVAGRWRLFPHAPLAPCVEAIEDFQPDTAKADYIRAILPGSSCRFTIRFWNLEKEEMERLLWSVVLERDLGHKLGKGRYLGFGSVRLHLTDDSFLTDWEARYSGRDDKEKAWRLPIRLEEWLNPKGIQHHAELRKALDATRI